MPEHENPADVHKRLRAYVKALDIEYDERDIQTILAGTNNLGDSLKLLRQQLAAGFRGDFLAFRLWQGFSANQADFRPPAMERGPFPSARLGHVSMTGTD